MGLTLTGEKCKVYKKEHDKQDGGKWYSYSIGVASKNMQGEWLNGFIEANFKKGTEINNKAVINIKRAFPTVSKYQDKTSIKWMILDFEIVEDGEETKKEEVQPSDIPFNDNGDSYIDVDAFNDEVPFV